MKPETNEGKVLLSQRWFPPAGEQPRQPDSENCAGESQTKCLTSLPHVKSSMHQRCNVKMHLIQSEGVVLWREGMGKANLTICKIDLDFYSVCKNNLLVRGVNKNMKNHQLLGIVQWASWATSEWGRWHYSRSVSCWSESDFCGPGPWSAYPHPTPSGWTGTPTVIQTWSPVLVELLDSESESLQLVRHLERPEEWRLLEQTFVHVVYLDVVVMG